MTNQNEKASPESNPVLAKVIARIASTNASESAAAKLAAAVKRDLKTLETVELSRPMEQCNMNSSGMHNHQPAARWMSPSFRILTASAAIAVLGLAAYFIFPGQSSAFAKMQTAIAQLKTIQCNSGHFRAGQELPWQTETILIQEPHLVRSECSDSESGDSTTVIDVAVGDYASWWPATLHGTIGVIPDKKLMNDVLHQFINVLRNASLDEIRQVDRYCGENNEWFVEFEYLANLPDSPPILVNVVVNEATSLPVEISFYDDEDNLVQNFTDFSFDQPLDPTLFLIELPEGYTAIDLNEEVE